LLYQLFHHIAHVVREQGKSNREAQ